MPEPDVEARLASLEARVAELVDRLRLIDAAREDAAAARYLAAANDRDVSEIRSEMRELRRAATSGFTAMRGGIADLRAAARTGFTEIRARLDRTVAGQAQVVELLNTMIGQQRAGEG